jgi:dTDP-4-dehydrorhamnose 3,5-epimerase
MFEFIKTEIEGPIIIKTDNFLDTRGSFKETYKKSEFVNAGITEDFVQTNISVSKRDVIRGLHYQKGDSVQGKLVSCASGEVLDIALDIRDDSPTRGQYIKVRLDDNTLFYIPPGFAHGFRALTPEAVFVYQCTAEYDPDNDAGYSYESCGMNWEIPFAGWQFIVSDKDRDLPKFE